VSILSLVWAFNSNVCAGIIFQIHVMNYFEGETVLVKPETILKIPESVQDIELMIPVLQSSHKLLVRSLPYF